MTTFGNVVRWPALIDYLKHYEKITGSNSNGIADFTPQAGAMSEGPIGDYVDKSNRLPTIADVRFALGYSSQRLGTTENYRAAITMNPVVTLWNPWNYRMKVSGFYITTSALPLKLRISLSGNPGESADVLFRDIIKSVDTEGERTKLRLNFQSATGSGDLVLGPGETMVFSPSSASLTTPTLDLQQQIQITLKPGYRTYGGYRFLIPKETSGFFTAAGDSDFQVQSMGVTEENVGYDPKAKNIYSGIYLDAFATLGGSTSHPIALRQQFEKTEAEKFYKTLTNFPSVKLSAVTTQNAAFAAVSYHTRTANDTQFPARVGIDSSPFTPFVETGANARRGSKHPVNAPYELEFRELSDWNGSGAPNANGAILTGTGGNNGLSRCVMAEVPLRPIRSLAELQHFQVRGPNPRPPFRTNILGNSKAYPLAASDAVKMPQAGSHSDQMQWDDSYVMNRLFFDDWFVSSIAPETNNWNGTSTKRTKEKVYEDHLAGTTRLPNAAYLPTATAAAKDLSEKTRHSTIASRLEVDGMFNVNSTSVEAWRSLLSHALDQEVPVLTASGVSLSSGNGQPVSRTTTAGDLSADGSLSNYQKFAGHRRLTPDQIQALAEEIVKQIRLRGPSLALSEFVNRQLRGGSDKNLALAGTIQAALDALGKRNDGTNPFKSLQELSMEITSNNLPPQEAEYLFPDAALGWTGEGLPGWITQADILRPIAPVLSARDDTFVIRTCGTAYAANGTTVTARVWCEAVVQRKAEFVSPDSAADPAADSNLAGPVNKKFGRRFDVVSFRYLNDKEI